MVRKSFVETLLLHCNIQSECYLSLSIASLGIPVSFLVMLGTSHESTSKGFKSIRLKSLTLYTELYIHFFLFTNCNHFKLMLIFTLIHCKTPKNKPYEKS